ncbi:ABC2 type transporter superfamily protein [Acanthamoeba castellanii str. Neff]|uniref:ABC2 type transporter superfamily protein n=1 Tax=Acanthamoeba castellanii (strain ATCC 30010 / Neff) TaxID=1257118 RepID=L8H1K0_ACACF|nr:ABC2 type transporter superfamily protein [Acanthamoeba castellanii str. Neff]ELR18266.1 ABC2 type transporter superfamily protein [Acanthamoeba castellanii str. Neff]
MKAVVCTLGPPGLDATYSGADVERGGHHHPASAHEKQLLRGVEGIVHPGELCAIMGASGAGKTTLLDVLASRGVRGRLSGEVRLNGQPVQKQSYFRRISGYVMQDNLMLDTLTVRETLSFAARLKLPSRMTSEQKERRVDEVMKELGLEHIAHSKVGNAANRGISGGEQKRVAIALELVSSPSLLFLDEPTSGLDSHGATNLVLMLKRTVICTIHQPSSHMFRAFDKLMLLAQGRASHVVDYFEKLSIRPPLHTNPADFILDIAFHARRKDLLEGDQHDPHHYDYAATAEAKPTAEIAEDYLQDPAATQAGEDDEEGFLIAADEEERRYEEVVPSTEQLADIYLKSTAYESLAKDLAREHTDSRREYYERQNLTKIEKYGVSIFVQMWVLLLRELLFMIRHPSLFYARFGQQIVMGLLVGSIWFQISENSLYVQNTLGVLFMTVALLSFVSFSSVPQYIEQRSIYNRERAAGMYHAFSYFISKTVVGFTLLAMLVCVECSIIYWMVGLRDAPVYHFFFFVFIVLLTSWAGEALIFAVCNLAGSTQIAQVVTALCLGFFFIFAGFYINANSIPDYYVWAKYSSFIKYGFEALVYNEFVERVVGGIPGKAIIDQTTEGLSVWTDVGVLSGMTGFYLLVAYLALQFLHKEKR